MSEGEERDTEETDGPGSSSEHRDQELYFRELFQLKVRCEYTRRYRDVLSRWLTRIAVLRAIASSGGIAGWVIWREYAFIWAAIIAASQVADALQEAIPYTNRQKAANGLLTDLDTLFIDTLFVWEGVFLGQFTNEEITDRRRKLMQLQLDFDRKHFPTGDLPARPDLLALAEQDAVSYLERMYREGTL